MPSGPEGLVDHPAFRIELERARSLLFAHPGRWRILYHYDGDGIASASCAVRALQRLGFPAQATALLAVERPRMVELLAATSTPVMVVDTGASWLDLFAAHPHPVIVLDHHQYPGAPSPPPLPDTVAFVDPLDWGVDGMNEMCASTLTWLFTVFLDARNWDNAPYGVSGAIADRQHVGGFKGLNARLVEEARERMFLTKAVGPPLLGGSLEESIALSVDPYLTGLSGRAVESRAFLTALGLDPQRPPNGLEPPEMRRLVEAVSNRMVRQGVRPEFVAALHEDGLFVPSLGLRAEELANLQNATGRIGAPGVGVALALGDPAALAQARDAERTWRQGVLNGLERIEKGGVYSLRALQWFESPDGSLAGTQAGLAMNYLLDSRRPVFVFTSARDGLKVSARGTTWLVGQGLDLATVCRTAAGRVGGEGGGHRVASGATIPPERREEFLTIADDLVGHQLPALATEVAS
ncbi:MAG: DHHA1 domain-containing protein [Thermoplasmata archaeon]|nr:DHHA1 domain-containing protein [Thermoplasmata archaeon]